MGAWGHQTFENDEALDFVAELIKSRDTSFIHDALRQAADGVCADAMTASRALAAAEIVAAISGNPSPALPNELGHYIASNSDPLDIQLARDAVIAIILDSELADLWKESGEYRRWRSEVLGLLRRLGGELPQKTKAEKIISPKPNRHHPGVPNLDTRAQKILFKYFWKNGWLTEKERGSSVSPEEEKFAREAGFLLNTSELTHDEVAKWACLAFKQANIANITNAFLASLSSRRLELRSALGSFAVGRHFPNHRYQKVAIFGCGVCGIIPTDLTEYDFDAQNFERHKWGGVRHEWPDYIAFDLTEFAKLPPCTPTKEDLDIFHQIIAISSSMPPKSSVNALAKMLLGVFPTNDSECKTLLSILGYCGILQPVSHPSYVDQYVTYAYRYHMREDFPFYPISEWRGADGVNYKALRGRLISLPLRLTVC